MILSQALKQKKLQKRKDWKLKQCLKRSKKKLKIGSVVIGTKHLTNGLKMNG
jgi:hypothetical protein